MGLCRLFDPLQGACAVLGPPIGTLTNAFLDSGKGAFPRGGSRPSPATSFSAVQVQMQLQADELCWDTRRAEDAPVTRPRKVLREGPTRSGAWRRAPRSALRSRGSPLMSCRFPSRALAKPRPEKGRSKGSAGADPGQVCVATQPRRPADLSRRLPSRSLHSPGLRRKEAEDQRGLIQDRCLWRRIRSSPLISWQSPGLRSKEKQQCQHVLQTPARGRLVPRILF